MQPTPFPSSEHHYHFVTGRLAESAMRSILKPLASQYAFAYSIDVMPITVAALMTPHWIRRHLEVPTVATHLVLPGYCETGTADLAESVGIPILVGPKDCRALPEWFGGKSEPVDLNDHDIEIVAELNHAPRRTVDEIISAAKQLRTDGADVIDFGCDPSNRCLKIADYIKALVDNGIKVSVDTFDPWEASQATQHGASLVLSVNSTNREQAIDWGTEVVVIPDAPGDDESFHETIEFLGKQSVPHRLDPILEPIGTGFIDSLVRYSQTRSRYPEHNMLMGVGNLTELTDVDSAGVNMILMAICQELGIKSVLTTQVINWSKSAVKECDLARRLTYHSIKHGIPPKRLSNQLVLLRDAKLLAYPREAIEALANTLKDNNYRIFAQDEELHLLSAGIHLHDSDPFRLFERLMQQDASSNVDTGHAFYLGYEMAKASIALQLGKQYEQDQALNWGYLTVEEDHHRIKRTSRHRKKED
jgi:dihydropteroate synthase-like protein